MGPIQKNATRQDESSNVAHNYNSQRFSLQFRVFRLGLLQDGDVGIGVFPEGRGNPGTPNALWEGTRLVHQSLECSAGFTDLGQLSGRGHEV
jgi:hypothetical protein